MQVLADEYRSVLVGDDGSIIFVPPEVEYSPTGLVVTPEAARHPGAVKQLIAEDRDFVSLRGVSTPIRMVGLSGMQTVRETKFVLARSESLLEIRPPISETEKERYEAVITSPFGSMLVLVLLWLIWGNTLMMKGLWSCAYLSLWPTIIVISVTISFAPSSAILPLSVAGMVTVILTFSPKPFRRYYHACSGLAAALVVVAVILAV